MPLKIPVTTVNRLILRLAAVLITAHLVMLIIYFQVDDYEEFDFIHLIDLDAEANLPTLFSVGILLFAALLAQLSAVAQEELGFYWRLLSALLLFMAIDEAVSLHEEFVGPWTDQLVESRGGEATGYFYYAWVIPYGLAVIGFGLVFVRFLLRLPRNTAVGLALSGVIFVTGAIGLEMCAGMEVSLHDDANSLYYRLLSTLEETLEILSIILLCRVIMGFLARREACFSLSEPD